MLITALIFLVVISVLVIAVSMMRDSDGRRDPMYSEHSWTARTRLLAILVSSAFGLVMPVYVLADNGSNGARKIHGNVVLSEAEAHGRNLFARGCSGCHALAATDSNVKPLDIGEVGPNLDALIAATSSDFNTRQAFIQDAILNGRAQGNGQMPPQLYTGQDAADVAAFVARVAGS